MECFIENTLLLADIDNLNYMMIIESDNGSSEKEGVITKIVNKIKEIWQKIKNFFTSKKMDNDIKTLKSMEPQAKQIEAHMKKEDPEKLEETQEKIGKNLVFEGIHIKDWLSAFKEFFKHNSACIKKGELSDCKPLGSFLNKKQKVARNLTIGLGLAIQVIVNLCLEFKGISIQQDAFRALDELERRSYRKAEIKGIKKGIDDAEAHAINSIDSNQEYTRVQKGEEMAKVRRKIGAARGELDYHDKVIRDYPSKQPDDIEEKPVSKTVLMMKGAIGQFNTIGSIIAGLLGIVINNFKKSEKLGQASKNNLSYAPTNLGAMNVSRMVSSIHKNAKKADESRDIGRKFADQYLDGRLKERPIKDENMRKY